jgi:hypothetical protein
MFHHTLQDRFQNPLGYGAVAPKMHTVCLQLPVFQYISCFFQRDAQETSMVQYLDFLLRIKSVRNGLVDLVLVSYKINMVVSWAAKMTVKICYHVNVA